MGCRLHESAHSSVHFHCASLRLVTASVSVSETQSEWLNYAIYHRHSREALFCMSQQPSVCTVSAQVCALLSVSVNVMATQSEWLKHNDQVPHGPYGALPS